MAHAGHDHPQHTDEEHHAQHDKAERHFARALRRCTEEKLCAVVILQEAIEVMVQGAITQAIPMSELVANVIETYNDTIRAMLTSGRPPITMPPSSGHEN